MLFYEKNIKKNIKLVIPKNIIKNNKESLACDSTAITREDDI